MISFNKDNNYIPSLALWFLLFNILKIRKRYTNKKMKPADKEPLITLNFTSEEIFALLNLLSDEDCPHPIWNDIANKIRTSKDEEEKLK
jgi:hypothetical protein